MTNYARMYRKPTVERLLPLFALIGPGDPGRELRGGPGRIRLGGSHRE